MPASGRPHMVSVGFEKPTVASGGTVNTLPREAATSTLANLSRRVRREAFPRMTPGEGSSLAEAARWTRRIYPEPARMP